MPRQKTFDKRTATTFALVNRPQHDPRIHDDEASSHVFTEIVPRNQQKIKQRGDLEEEFGLSGALKEIRKNEGEAAEYGIFYDDTKYDYMQHMRDVGTGGGETVWVEASAGKGKDKKKAHRLEDALRDVKLDDDEDDTQSIGGISLGGRSFASSKYSSAGGRMASYQDQQNIPDELAGFQPDMDPRLREVLEALEDDAYVDYEDGMFEQLTDDAQEVDRDEWEFGAEDDEDGWESDDTTKPVKEYNVGPALGEDDASQQGEGELPAPELDNGDLMATLARSKGLPDSELQYRKPSSGAKATSFAPSSAAISTSTIGRRKKRKGALTSSTGFSMSSSALARTESLSVLDSRFDKLAEQYMGDLDEEDEEGLDDQMSLASGATGMTGRSKASTRWGGSQVSEAPSLVDARFDAAGFNSVMDEFLGSTGGAKAKKMKKGGRAGFWGQQSGMEQLDEIRKGLGGPRIRQNAR